ncbi:hypothetical protein IAR50_003891 [Cryptococcus sp. DSM 104548]
MSQSPPPLSPTSGPLPSPPPPVKPIRIPSNGTIHQVIHVGITPLIHSHLIGLMTERNEGKGEEIWVISHSPQQDRAGKYENIRLT